MFNGCASLEVVPHIDTRRSTNFEGMFNGCIALKEIGGLDLRNSTQLNAMFYGCVALEKLNVKNINYSLTLGSVEAYSNLLETESLINLVYELHNSTSTKTVTMGAVNLAKLSNIYVKTIDITDEMRAEDEFVDLKIPFEVCESTDVGAMLITDYALTKKWRLQ